MNLNALLDNLTADSIPVVQDAFQEMEQPYFTCGSLCHFVLACSKQIRIVTIGYDGQRHDVTFRPGDVAEHDSYNLSYVARITKITDKTVTFDHNMSGPKRLKLEQFAWRNYRFNAAETAARNADTMMYI